MCGMGEARQHGLIPQGGWWVLDACWVGKVGWVMVYNEWMDE